VTDAAPRWPFVLAWLGAAAVLVALAASLLVASDSYPWSSRLSDLSIAAFAFALAGAGVAFAGIALLALLTVRQGFGADWWLLFIILAAGLVMRVLMIPSTAVLEDDFYRYLWDGAVTARGVNPFAHAPADALEGQAGETLDALAAEGRGVLERVNHPQLKTIYPPVAQGAFAAAYTIEPWSLRAWRVVCLIGDLATLGLGLGLLLILGRPAIWIALYWLNPLVVKELMNSAHMEAIVLPFVMATVVLLALRRPVWAVVPLGLAVGAKVWPAVLAPLVLRPLLARPVHLVAALVILVGMGLCWVLPPLVGGLDKQSGFVAYASYWQTNSALFQSLLKAMRAGFDWAGWPAAWAGPASRALVAGSVGLVAVCAAWQPPGDAQDRVRRAAIVVVALFFLSPAQFPWYATWALVFLPFVPLTALVGATVLLPLYYLSFHFIAHGDHDQYAPWLIWVQWVPIWLLLAADAFRGWRTPLAATVGRSAPSAGAVN
jgi:alpha-1,6-mannosyltransferase